MEFPENQVARLFCGQREKHKVSALHREAAVENAFRRNVGYAQVPRVSADDLGEVADNEGVDFAAIAGGDVSIEGPDLFNRCKLHVECPVDFARHGRVWAGRLH